MIEYIKNISIPIVVNSTNEIDLAIKSLTSAIPSALNNVINPSETKITNEKTPWWNQELCAIRYKVRQAQKTSREGGLQLLEYRRIKAEYKRGIRKAKTQSCKWFCTIC